MRRWRLLFVLWLIALAAVLVAELGIRREPRTTYATEQTGLLRVAPAHDRGRSENGSFRPIGEALRPSGSTAYARGLPNRSIRGLFFARSLPYIRTYPNHLTRFTNRATAPKGRR